LATGFGDSFTSGFGDSLAYLASFGSSLGLGDSLVFSAYFGSSLGLGDSFGSSLGFGASAFFEASGMESVPAIFFISCARVWKLISPIGCAGSGSDASYYACLS
jgi:hypothetical protein